MLALQKLELSAHIARKRTGRAGVRPGYLLLFRRASVLLPIRAFASQGRFRSGRSQPSLTEGATKSPVRPPPRKFNEFSYIVYAHDR